MGRIRLSPSNSSSGVTIESVPIVYEFFDVFPDDLPGLPTDRELEFEIEFLPGSAPVSIPPYRMALTKLKELKVQLQDLVDKGFIRPSVSLGCTGFVCEEKRWNFTVVY